ARAAAVETERLLGEARQRVVLAAKEELMAAREAFEEESTRRRREIERREQVVEQRLGGLEGRARGLELRGRALEDRDQAIAAKEAEARARLEQIAGLTAQEAKQELLRRLEDEARNDAAALARDLKEQARKSADKEAKKILAHAKEVAWLAGIIAAELKLDVQLAKRGALLHDIGKVLTHEHDGTHVQLGVEVATKHGEHPTVINCIAAHHDDVAHESPISV